jgi:hypothetical protein
MVGGVKFGLSFEFYFKNVLHNIIDWSALFEHESMSR